ncbi:MAG: type II toxin-antitoxin system PemK/MazF family toxin [Deltaproteobacteria bacterium]|nr:type II toxin-antitoxin system PemK/MazF family toxin [Deltaproteobacteria bacterium]
MDIRRGEIVLADLSPRSGSEQRGRRPVLVISHDAFNRTPGWRSVIVVPFSTSAGQASRGPTAVPLPAGAGGLRKASVALCHQITTIDREKIREKLGKLASRDLARVEEGTLAAIGMS